MTIFSPLGELSPRPRWGALGVVVLDVGLEHRGEMTLVDEEKPVASMRRSLEKTDPDLTQPSVQG